MDSGRESIVAGVGTEEIPHAPVSDTYLHGDMSRTTSADWLDKIGIPPIVIVAAVALLSTQLIIIIILLIRCVLQRRSRAYLGDYEKIGADYFLIERAKTSKQEQSKKGGTPKKEGRISTSEPDIQAVAEILDKPPIPSLRRHSMQPGARRSDRKKLLAAVASRRGASLQEDQSLAAQKRELYALEKSQSTPQDLFRAGMGSKEGLDGGTEMEGESSREAAASIPLSQFGQISFAVTYDKELEQVKVFVEQAIELSVKTPKGAADTFVKVSLTPDQGVPPSASGVAWKTANPAYRHNFIFRVAPEAVTELVLKFQVFELDRFSQSDPIGEVEYPLSEDADLERPVTVWRDLQKPQPQTVERVSYGELLFSLTYLPNAEKLTLVVLKARDLRRPEWRGHSVGKDVLDTFVKITLVKSGKVLKYKRTHICRRSCHPVYNEGFSLKVRQSELDDVRITLAACVRLSHVGFHRVIGRCIVGRNVGGDGSSHWQDMVNTPRSAVCQWHMLV